MNALYTFGPFEMDPGEQILSREGAKIPLTPRAFDVLHLLVQRSGNLVEKKDLIDAVWHGSFVEDANVFVTISMIRKALKSEDCATYVETIPKRGYRFTAPVTLSEKHRSTSLSPLPEFEVKSPVILPDLYVPSNGIEQIPEAGRDELHTPTGRPTLYGKRWISAGWVAACLALLIFVILFPDRSPLHKHFSALAGEAQPIRSLAVLPFTQSSRQDDSYLGIGMSAAVTDKLANLGRVLVRPSDAMEKYASTSIEPQAAGKAEGVDAVLGGHVEHVGGRVRLTVRLTRTADGVEVWSQNFDEKDTDILDVQDSVSRQVAQSILPNLTRENEHRLTQRTTESSSAYEAYMKGHFFMDKRTVEALDRSLGYYREAITADPSYAQAYAGMAASYALLGLYSGLPPKTAFPEARKAAAKALELNPNLSEAHTTLGFVDFYFEWDNNAADREFRKAIADNPDDVIAHSWSGENLAATGHYPEALSEAMWAKKSDPLSPAVYTNTGNVLFLAGNTNAAIQSFRSAIELDEKFPRAHYRLGNAYLALGQPDAALPEFKKAVLYSGGDPYYEAGVGQSLAQSGKLAQAEKVLSHLIGDSSAKYVPPYAIAQIYAGLGDKDRAFHWLDKACLDRSTSMAYLRVDPSLNSLRSDPRFATLARKLRF